MKIKKAIITTAGFGTRFLPVTKTLQKEMLPILNRPLVDYVVEDCIKAGIEEIIFVINEHNLQILHFYRENQRLKEYLKKMNKAHLYDEVKQLHEQATFHFVKQKDTDAYGTAVPVKLAQSFVEHEEAFLVLMGDDFIFHPDGSSEIKAMINDFDQAKANGLMTCVTKPDDQLFRYGVTEYQEKNGFQFLSNLVEKPAPGTAPSNLVNISKYIFTPEIFSIIDNQKINPQSGELYITDSILTLSKTQPVVVHTTDGIYLDGGDVLNWLKANLIIAKNNQQLFPQLETFLKEELL